MRGFGVKSFTKASEKVIPHATIARLSTIYNVLEQLILSDGCPHISSNKIGELIGVPSHTIRKDINYLGDIGMLGKGYGTKDLRAVIAQKLGLEKRRAAIVGLGKLGTAILDYKNFFSAGIEIVAGFDSDINRIDTIKTRTPLFASREMTDRVKEYGIEMAFLTCSPDAANICFERLAAGGIKAIINFTPKILFSEKIHIRNIGLVLESTILSAMIGLDKLGRI
jgi:redox-sensing transcriptional repressor